MADYTIDRGLGVRDRMNLLATVHSPATLALFDMLGVASGARCIDLGCGGGHIAMELARRVGPSGHVTGLDLDEALLAAARDEAAEQGLDNVTFGVESVEHLAGTGFDLAFARMLLSHLSGPAGVVGRMASAVLPGGIVIVEDVHFAGCFSEPMCPAYARWVDWFREVVRRSGGDLDVGPRLPELLREAGLTSVGVRVAQPAFLAGPAKQLQQMSMEKTRSAVIAAGVASADEYDATHVELQAFTDDPTTLLASPRIIQSWGYRG